jgi:hypothetical protein
MHHCFSLCEVLEQRTLALKENDDDEKRQKWGLRLAGKPEKHSWEATVGQVFRDSILGQHKNDREKSWIVADRMVRSRVQLRS